MTRQEEDAGPAPPWTSGEGSGVRWIRHSRRWLGVVGAHLAGFGLLMAVGPWLLPGVELQDAAPLLAVGSMMGAAFVVMAIHLTFHTEEVRADQLQGVVTHVRGVGPWMRRDVQPLEQVRRVSCEPVRLTSSSASGSSVRHVVKLVGDGFAIPLAASMDKDLVRVEGRQWSDFLGLEFHIREDAGPRELLREQMALRRRQGGGL